MGTAVFALSGTVTAGQVGMDLLGERWSTINSGKRYRKGSANGTCNTFNGGARQEP